MITMSKRGFNRGVSYGLLTVGLIGAAFNMLRMMGRIDWKELNACRKQMLAVINAKPKLTPGRQQGLMFEQAVHRSQKKIRKANRQRKDKTR